MNFGDLVSAKSPETGMFYGIYAGEGRCWKYCSGAQELINQNAIRCTFIKLAEGGFGGNWFEHQSKEIKVGSKVWCSDSSYETAIEKPHMTFVVIGRGERGYRTVALEDVEKYNKGHQVTIFPWNFAVPTGKEVFVADLSVKKKKKKEEEPIFKKGDRVLCVAGNCQVDEGETYEVLEDVAEDSRFVEVLTPKGGERCFPYRFKKVIAPERYEPKFQPGDLVECVAGNCDVDEGETYEVLRDVAEDSRFVKVLTRKGERNCYTYRFKKVIVPKGYEPKFQPGDLVECIEGNYFLAKGSFYRVVKSYPHPLTGKRFVTVKRDDWFESELLEDRFVLVPKGDKWSFEINNGAQVDSHEIAENLTRKKPIIYHTGVAKDKAFFEIHSSFIFKWQQLGDLWYKAHQYLTLVNDYETYHTYVTDLSNIDKLLHIFRAVKKHPWPADGYGRRKVEVFHPVL